MMNQFEQHIKHSLEKFEAEYNPADWNDLQNRLSKAKAAKPVNIGKGWMIAASVVAVAGLVYYFSTTTEDTISSDNPISQTQNVITREVANPVRQVDDNSQKPAATNQKPAINNNSQEEKVSVSNNIQENKSVSSEKTVPQVVNNTTENKIPVQEQDQTPLKEESLRTNSAVLHAGFHSSMDKICEGAPVQFIPDNNDASYTYKWIFGDGNSSTTQNPAHIFAEAGTYTVKLRVTSVKDKKYAEQKNKITVLPAPSIEVDYSVSEDNNLLVNFDADADKATEWKWDFGDKQTSSERAPSHVYGKKGNYAVTVTAKNAAGCLATLIKNVSLITQLNMLAPNAFSPDGNGINDTWMPVALLNGDYIFTLTISDKSGNTVYKTSDKNHPWDGQGVKTGDTFMWRAVVKDKNGEESNYQGLITISE